MNSECPVCGAHLVADILAKHTAVPLYDDGYLPSEGSLEYSEVANIRCPECGFETSSKYYHGTEDELRSAVRVATEFPDGEEEREKKEGKKP